jgi:hypothetical protein
MNPESVVQRRFDAYNAHDLALFLSLHSEHIRIFRPPNVEPVVVGTDALGAFYASQRFNKSGLHADLLHRIVIGNKVIDHERISGARDQPFEVVVAHEVVDQRIASTWFFAAD